MCNHTAEGSYLVCTTGMKCSNDIAVVFGVEPVESALEPTMSQNMMVSWRRSANGERLHRTNAWAMVRRRAKGGITTEVCNHTFRGTGITAYPENGGEAHASTRTTQLYDRREPRHA